MKRILSLIVFIIAVSPSFSQSVKAEKGIAEVGLVVRDIEESENFYTEVIGMKPTGGFELSEEWSREAGAANGKPFKVKTFKLQDDEAATVLKLAYFDKVSARPEQSGINSYSGMSYLTLHFKDFDALVKRLHKNHIKIIGWVKRDNYQLLFIKDSNGVFLELVGPSDSK